MPFTKKRIPQIKYSATDLDPVMIGALVGQYWSVNIMERRGLTVTEEEKREAWFNNREYLLINHVQTPEKPVGFTHPAFLPGTRPDAWWEFEAPEPISDEEPVIYYLKRLGLLWPGEFELVGRCAELRGCGIDAWSAFKFWPINELYREVWNDWVPEPGPVSGVR